MARAVETVSHNRSFASGEYVVHRFGGQWDTGEQDGRIIISSSTQFS